MKPRRESTNPYVIGVPLTRNEGFYGRSDILDFVRNVAHSDGQNVVVLYGQRRIGKTSVLHQAASRLSAEGRCAPVYFDLQGKEHDALGSVLWHLSKSISRATGTSSVTKSAFDDHGLFFRQSFLPSVLEQLAGRRLLVLLDEFDVLGDDVVGAPSARDTLFPYLQQLISQYRQVAYVFVVGRRIEELTTHFQTIFKQAAYRRIGLLRPEDAVALVREPAKELVNYSDPAVDKILALSAGHPYFTQLLCFEAFADAGASGTTLIEEETIVRAASAAIESGHGALNWFWDGLPRAERFFMSAVAEVADPYGSANPDAIRGALERHRVSLTGLELSDAPDRLTDWGILTRSDRSEFSFVVELVRRWVRETHPLHTARRDIDYISKRAVRLFENAQEAHAQGELSYALSEYQRTLEANPNHSGAQLGLAQVYLELGNLEEAIEAFECAYKIDEMSARDGLVRARLARARSYEDEGVESEAVLQYERVQRLAPGESLSGGRLAGIWTDRAGHMLADSDLASAADALYRSLAYCNEASARGRVRELLIRFSKESESSGESQLAEWALATLVKLMPDDPEITVLVPRHRLRRAKEMLEEERLSDCLGELRKIAGSAATKSHDAVLDQELWDLLQEAAKDLHSLDSVEGFLDLETIAAELFPAEDRGRQFALSFWMERARKLKEMGRLSGAQEAISRASSLAPEDGETSSQLACLKEEVAREERIRALFELGIGAQRAGDAQTALPAWKALIQLDVFFYEEQNIGSLLANAATTLYSVDEKAELIRRGLSAQRDRNWITALSIWDALVEDGVDEHAGIDIRARWQEARSIVSRSSHDTEAVRPSPRSRLPWHIGVWVGSVVAGIVFLAVRAGEERVSDSIFFALIAFLLAGGIGALNGVVANALIDRRPFLKAAYVIRRSRFPMVGAVLGAVSGTLLGGTLFVVAFGSVLTIVSAPLGAMLGGVSGTLVWPAVRAGVTGGSG